MANPCCQRVTVLGYMYQSYSMFLFASMRLNINYGAICDTTASKGASRPQGMLCLSETVNQWVAGSSPAGGANITRNIRGLQRCGHNRCPRGYASNHLVLRSIAPRCFGASSVPSMIPTTCRSNLRPSDVNETTRYLGSSSSILRLISRVPVLLAPKFWQLRLTML